VVPKLSQMKPVHITLFLEDSVDAGGAILEATIHFHVVESSGIQPGVRVPPGVRENILWGT
jgi:hypothetical protein